MGYARRTDSTQAAIVQALRQTGWTVELTQGWSIDAIGHRRGQVTLFEFKAKQGRQTKSQQRLVAQGFPIVFLTSPEDVARL